jgi:uncharacterized coiled-coil DUF342 family protein
MDLRTMVRELEEVIARAQSATERETAVVEALPECGLRRRKWDQVRKMRAHVHRLRNLRSSVKAKRRPASPLH